MNRFSLKIIFWLFATLLSVSSAWGQAPDLSWIDDVGARTVPAGTKIYYADDYGAVGDGAAMNTGAINRAAEVCHQNGGGTVTFRGGRYLTGSIYLKEGVRFIIPAGSTLLGSTDIADYPEIDTRIAGVEMRWPSALINVIDGKNVLIGGRGTIHAQGKVFWDYYWSLRRDYESRGLRWIVDYDAKRPRTILVQDSEDVTLKDLTIKQAGFWTVQILYSTYCTVDGIVIRNNEGGHGPSTDGVDIDSSSRVLVENCDIDCNDDNFCLKSGRDADGLRVNRPTEYIVIRNCISRAGAGMLTCGSETSGGIRYVLAEGLQAEGTSNVIRLKSALNRGGTTEHIYVRGVRARNIGRAFEATLNWNPAYSYSVLPPEYEGKTIPPHWTAMLEKVSPEDGLPFFRNIWLSDFRIDGAAVFMNVLGREESRMEGFHFQDIYGQVDKLGAVEYACGWTFSGAIEIRAEDGLPLTVRHSEDTAFPAELLPHQPLREHTTVNGLSERRKFNFNPGWKVFVGDPEGASAVDFDDRGWKSVTLPYAWNEDDAFRLAIDEIATGVAWYRKTFDLPASESGKKVFLEFEGLRQAGTVYVNGQELILHENGVMAFGVDITSSVRFGASNTVAVRTDNSWEYHEKATGTSYQWNNRNFNVPYGGITKNVILHLTPDVYQTLPLYSNLGTTGVYVYADRMNVEKSSAVIHAESEVKNESPRARRLYYEVEVRDMDGKTVGRFTGRPQTLQPGETAVLKASKPLSGLHFWSWGYGYLYTVTTALKENGVVLDAVVTRTGFRKTETGGGEVKLNDRVIQLKGYAQRTSNEWPAVGMSVPAWLSDYSNGLIVKGNGNFVRWMHVTPWKQDVESADRVGLIQVMPAGDAEKDVQGRQWEQRKELMRDAIIYNRNNPSILFYECGNESISEGHMAEMIALRDQYDPHGGRAIGSREMLDIDTAEWGGEMLYINKSAKHPMFATEYCRDEGLRKYWDSFSFPYHREGARPLYRNADASSYNHNQDVFALELIRRWNDYYVCRPGTGRRVSSGGAKIIFSDSNTHYRGEENYRRSGVVDPMRIAKDGYGAHFAMWDGWVDPDHRHTYIIGHWNYPKNTVKDVYVVSAAPTVVLTVNGKPVGESERSDGFTHTFRQVAFEPGELKAVSYDEQGHELSVYTIETAGDPAAIRLTVMTSPAGMSADGADLALIEVEVVDAQGRRCPLSNDVIDFRLEGPAEWRGGIAQGPDNFILSRRLPVECGVNRVLVRSTTQPGRITLKASSGVLEPASVEIRTLPVAVVGGLSETFPGETLPSFTGRGPTPSTPSYTQSRVSVPVRSASAGVYPEHVKNSFDDNELSEWRNDGRLSTAWITYELEREAELSEISLKLTGWRTRSYPLEIFAGDRLIWSGDTDRSLGYIYLSVDPVRTKTVSIRLKGAAQESDAFAQIVEVAEPTAGELDLFKTPGGEKTNNELRIVEVDFLESVR